MRHYFLVVLTSFKNFGLVTFSGVVVWFGFLLFCCCSFHTPILEDIIFLIEYAVNFHTFGMHLLGRSAWSSLYSINRQHELFPQSPQSLWHRTCNTVYCASYKSIPTLTSKQGNRKIATIFQSLNFNIVGGGDITCINPKETLICPGQPLLK